LYVGRKRVIHDLARHRSALWRLLGAGLVLGVLAYTVRELVLAHLTHGRMQPLRPERHLAPGTGTS
jgi:hypothetical protein